MSTNSSPPAVSQDIKSASSIKSANGTTSPTKNTKARPSPKPQSGASAKKTTRAALQNKSPDDLCDQILELKKTLSCVSDERNVLNVKLRRLEEESNKKNESEKNSANSIINNLKRKIQRLETTLKDKENVIKKLQNDVKVAKQSVAKQGLETPKENSAGKRSLTSPQESTRPTPTKNHAPQRRQATPGKGHDQNATSAETKQLKCWLRRALGIDQIGGNYEEMNNLELIAEIQTLTEELRLLRKIAESGDSPDPPSDWKAKEIATATELDKLKSELVKVKEDRVEYYCAMENKDTELAKLTEELKKLGKDRADGKERLDRNRPGTFVRKQSSQPGSGVKASPAKTADTAGTLHRPSPQARKSKPAAGTESPAKQVTNGKAKMNVTTTITKQAGGVTKSTTITIKKTSRTKPTIPGGPSSVAAEAPKAAVPNGDAVNGKALVSPEEIENFRENLAAKKIQKSWKQRQAKDEKPKAQRVNGVADEEAVRNFQENRAAKVIQKGWKDSREKATLDKDIDEAVITIQATARGHSKRVQHLESVKGSCGDPILIDWNGDAPDGGGELDTSATVIQAAARAHHAREEMLQNWEGGNGGGDVLRDGAVPS